MPRYFTLAEAESLLPKVERSMRDALNLYIAHNEAEGELQQTLSRITMLGGAMVDRDEIGGMRHHRDSIASQLNDAITAIHDLGCQVKDLSTGLIDFPTLYRGDEVLLCWKFGEKGIKFWHGLEEGFRGRKPIDADFMQNHRGDRVN